jgi:hypothetical protein
MALILIPICLDHRAWELTVDKEHILQVAIRSCLASADGEVIWSDRAGLGEQLLDDQSPSTYPVFGKSEKILG